MEPTFVFEGDKIYAMQGGQVMASSPIEDADEFETRLASCDCGHGNCTGDCGSCSSCKKSKEAKATHVITPNGVKGKILGHVEDVWGEGEVTVRLENGRIAHLKVADAEYIAPEDAEFVNPIAQLEERLDADVIEDRSGLEQRRKELASIRADAAILVKKGASETDAARLDQIAVTADYELNEVGQALDHLDTEDGQAFQPPAPYNMHAHPSQRPEPSTWLDNTMQDMVDEAEQYDYDKLMSEGPEALVAEQPDAVVADQGATQAIAASFIREKTAAADPSVREKYEATWLARVEQVRREELLNRKQTATKEAATKKETDDDAPDSSLFL